MSTTLQAVEAAEMGAATADARTGTDHAALLTSVRRERPWDGLCSETSFSMLCFLLSPEGGGDRGVSAITQKESPLEKR